jgi:hypothetical protein
MPSNYLFRKFIAAATMLIELFVYKTEPVLPFYLECDNNNNTIGKRCLDGDMDSVFFV